MSSVITDPFRQKLLLGAMALGVVMDGVDGAIVNVALPSMASYFSTDTGTIAWVIITYLLMMAGLLLVFGKIADQGRAKFLFLAGFAVFTIGSAVCGVAPSLEVLLGARALQGTGAAMIAAVAPLLCIRYLPKDMLGTAFGVIAAAASIGFAVGPAIGGVITQYLSWHWIFLINIPIGIVGVLFASRVIPADEEDRGRGAASFDYLGAILLFASMVFWVFTLEELPARSAADSGILTYVILSLVCTALFVARQLTTKDPFLNIRIFTSWQFSAVLVAFLLINIVFTGILYLLPFYLTSGMQFDLMTCGLLLLVPPAVIAITSVPFGRWSDKTGRRRPFAIIACAIVAVYSAYFTVVSPEYGIVPLLFGFILMGLAFGIGSAPASTRIIEKAPRGEESTASSIVMTIVYFAGMLGTASYAAIFTLATREAGAVVDFASISCATLVYGFQVAVGAGLVLAVIAVILSAIVPDAE
ncbi:DHA2 family efflux MFS transporter permease subunit [Methanoregula formicica]|uniref:Drug resistance transporter, EmrB/QacA subfamily n=1 Tax=Methanoregula formicica (strain DSM 22288 / NBRC 105244 / SMSP) TaxID=593750 RepID=L0H9V7_METFS|nr:DHA2 family efflux MFS transporter permease subunit [Methanoregula formicica]AGB01532.1 drug resistance transporter, EmrB/QacA subfamily [Methanoregula formicica SMSP]